jgi:hypothetical protein
MAASIRMLHSSFGHQRARRKAFAAYQPGKVAGAYETSPSRSMARPLR